MGKALVGNAQAWTAIPMPLWISNDQSQPACIPGLPFWGPAGSDILQEYLTDSYFVSFPLSPKLCLLSYASDNRYKPREPHI